MREPYHGLMAQAGSFVMTFRAHGAHVLRRPPRSRASPRPPCLHPAESAAPIFAFDCVALEDRLCDDRGTTPAAAAGAGSGAAQYGLPKSDESRLIGTETDISAF